MRSPAVRTVGTRIPAAAVAAALLCLAAPAPVQAQDAASAAGLLGGAQQQQGAGAAAAAGLAGGRSVDVIRSAEPASAEPKPPTDLRPPERPAPRAPTDFQLLAASSLGALLPVFGQNLFAGAPSTFAPVLDAAPASDYPLGPGDEILVRGWGQVDIDVRAVVTREGTISIPRVGVISVGGVRYEALPAVVKSAVSRYYRNFEVSVSLGRLRSIQVFVVGHAQRPGLYTVSSLSTLMNALFASGGPSATGSMRRLQLRRGERLVGELDLYDVLLRGDKSKDQRLLSGDVIFVPPVGPVAAVGGKVKDPAVYELREDSTLGDLVAWAGGAGTTAATQTVTLERLDRTRGSRVVTELPWADAARETRLLDGDVVALRPMSQRYENAVTLRGNVAFPVRTAWRAGMRVSDLIPDRSALVSEGYWARVASRAFQTSPAEALSKAESKGLQGAAPQRIQTDVENLVDEVNWDYAVVERLDRTAIEPRLIPFHLGRAIEKDPAQDLPLEAGDVVTVFSKKDVLSPAERRTYFVRVEGEVQRPGVYQVKPGETLRQLVERAGGFAASAYLFGAEFTRESVRKDQQRRLEEVAARAEQELERSTTERLSRAPSAEEAAAVKVQVEAQRAALSRLRALRASGRMVLELATTASKPQDLPDLVLEDGDRLFVPLRNSTIGVYGAVYNQSNFIHRPGKSVDEYIALAGGPTRGADAGSTYVLRADGSVVSRRQTTWFFGRRELMPSDSVVVPEEFAPTSWVRELKDWSQIFYQFGLGVAAIRILRN